MYEYLNLPNCSIPSVFFLSGLLTRGLDAGVEEYVRIIQRVAMTRNEAFVNSSNGIGEPLLSPLSMFSINTAPWTLGTKGGYGGSETYSIPDVLNGEDLTFVRTMSERYLDDVRVNATHF